MIGKAVLAYFVSGNMAICGSVLSGDTAGVLKMHQVRASARPEIIGIVVVFVISKATKEYRSTVGSFR